MKIANKVTLFAATILVGIAQVNAAPTLSQQIDSLPALEIPAFAVKTVLGQEEDQQLDLAVKVIRSVAVQSETALVPTVVSIVRALPQYALVVASEASKLSPNQAKEIALRVSQAVPTHAGDVAYVVADAAKLTAPKAMEIAELLVRVVPSSSDSVLSSIADRVPSTRSTISSRFPNAIVTKANPPQVIIVFTVQSTPGSLSPNVNPNNPPTPTNTPTVQGFDPARIPYGTP